MTVTRDVILDLLPLYLADEASEDTRALVEAHLQADAKLAQLVEQAQQNDLLDNLKNEISIPLTKEHEMKTFQKTKRLTFQYNLFLAFAISTSLLLIAFRGDSEGNIRWLWQDSDIGYAIFVVAAVFWIAFGNVNYQLNKE